MKLEIGEDPCSDAAVHILAGSWVVLENCLVEAMVNTAIYVVGSEQDDPTTLCMWSCILGRHQSKHMRGN